jgi:hypothetical protein
MEHRPLKDPRARVVRENALATYLGLVGAVEGAVVTRPMGFTLVRGPGHFSFCNFAAGFDVAEGDVCAVIDLLDEQSRDCFGFYVFSMSGDAPSDFREQLRRRGYESRQGLVGMASEASPSPGVVSARVVADSEERRLVASFMARQFFWKMQKEVREAIAASTAASSHTVWVVGPARDPEAAVMLVEQPASVGLFNLCVRPELRRKGLGAGLVRAVQAAASASGLPVVLQCEPGLETWYKGLGFETVGTVEALTLSHDDGGDIIA